MLLNRKQSILRYILGWFFWANPARAKSCRVHQQIQSLQIRPASGISVSLSSLPVLFFDHTPSHSFLDDNTQYLGPSWLQEASDLHRTASPNFSKLSPVWEIHGPKFSCWHSGRRWTPSLPVAEASSTRGLGVLSCGVVAQDMKGVGSHRFI